MQCIPVCDNTPWIFESCASTKKLPDFRCANLHSFISSANMLPPVDSHRSMRSTRRILTFGRSSIFCSAELLLCLQKLKEKHDGPLRGLADIQLLQVHLFSPSSKTGTNYKTGLWLTKSRRLLISLLVVANNDIVCLNRSSSVKTGPFAQLVCHCSICSPGLLLLKLCSRRLSA